jgi:hypothetical protein
MRRVGGTPGFGGLAGLGGTGFGGHTDADLDAVDREVALRGLSHTAAAAA